MEVSDIDDYLKKYRFSAEEQEDLKKAYENTKGNINAMLDKYMQGDETDRERYIEDIQKYIDNGMQLYSTSHSFFTYAMVQESLKSIQRLPRLRRRKPHPRSV